MQLGRAFDLRRQIRRGSRQKPRRGIRAQSKLSLSARFAGDFLEARGITDGNTVSAAAIPLREPAPGRRTGDPNAHLASLLASLEFCAHVGVDFAAENNFFEHGTGPSHENSPTLRLEILLAEPK